MQAGKNQSVEEPLKDLLTQGVAQVNGHFADRDGQNQRPVACTRTSRS